MHYKWPFSIATLNYQRVLVGTSCQKGHGMWPPYPTSEHLRTGCYHRLRRPEIATGCQAFPWPGRVLVFCTDSASEVFGGPKLGILVGLNHENHDKQLKTMRFWWHAVSWGYPVGQSHGWGVSKSRSFGRHEKCIYGGRVQWVTQWSRSKTMRKMVS